MTVLTQCFQVPMFLEGNKLEIFNLSSKISSLKRRITTALMAIGNRTSTVSDSVKSCRLVNAN